MLHMCSRQHKVDCNACSIIGFIHTPLICSDNTTTQMEIHRSYTSNAEGTFEHSWNGQRQ